MKTTYQPLLLVLQQITDTDKLAKMANLYYNLANSASSKELRLVVDLENNKNSIGTAQIQRVVEWNSRKSNDVKLCIIQRAEKLTLEAQSALLKTLEEPSPKSLIILATTNENYILSTIRSRCVTLQSTNENSMEELHEIEQFLLKNEAERIIYLNSMSASRDELKNFIKLLLKYFTSYRNLGRYDSKDMLESLKEFYLAVQNGVNVKLITANILVHLSKHSV